MTPAVAARADGDELTIAADRALLKRRSVHGAGLTLGAQAVRCVLQLTTQIMLARWLAPREFGLLAMVAPVMSLVQIFNDLGLSQATVQRADISQRELSALFWINLGVSLGLASVLACLAPAVAWFYHEPRLGLITVACASLLVLSGAGAQQIALMNRRMQFGGLALIDVSCVTVAALVGLAAAWAGAGAWSLVAMQGANSLTILVMAWCSTGWVPLRPSRGNDVGGLLRFGGHLTGFNLLAYLEGNLGPVLIGRLQGAAALGFYDRAYKLVIVPWWQVSLPVARVAVSLLSRLSGSPADYAMAWRRMLQGLFLVAAPGLLWAALTAHDLAPALLGRAWQAAAPLMADLSLATMLVPFGASAYWLFVSQGRVSEQLRFGFISGAALIASSVIGVQWGPLGVARCYLAFAPFVQGIHFWAATRRGPVTQAMAWQAVWPICLSLGVAAACVQAASMIPTNLPQLLRLAMLAAVSYAACAAALLTFGPGRRILHDVWVLRAMLVRGR